MGDKIKSDGHLSIDLDLKEIKKDLIIEYIESSKRGLKHTAKWVAEFICTIDVDIEQDVKIATVDLSDMKELETYTLAKSYLDLEEYLRAAHVSKHSKPCTTSYFIGMYARYLDAETKALDSAHDMLTSMHNDETKQMLQDIRNDLLAVDRNGELDGYCLYLYGVVLLKLNLIKESIGVLIRAIIARPLLWAAWYQLSNLIKDLEEIRWLYLPKNWVYQLFVGQVNTELHHNVAAIQIYETLQTAGLAQSTYIQAQLALSYYNIRDLDFAEELFAQLHKFDPHRIDNMDSYSNILFVKNNDAELAVLAHRCMQTQKFREETCCVIGNFYSLRSDHDKALLYFQRALKLNPAYHVAWTLVGHELMELKNFNGAIHAYRQSVEKCPNDFKSWYGLGQAYEIINMTSYSVYFYRKAQMLRPNDSRMIMPLADAYERLGQLQSAKKCYLRAHYVRDDDGMALMKLAGLCEKMDDRKEAAAAYTEYLYLNPEGKGCQEEYCTALKYLANYHMKNGELNEAEAAAYKCSLLAETKYEAKVLLNQIAELRLLDDTNQSLDMGTESLIQSPGESSFEISNIEFSDVTIDDIEEEDIEDQDRSLEDIDLDDEREIHV